MKPSWPGKSLLKKADGLSYMWRRKRNICGYWECKRRIVGDSFLCPQHYQDWIDGLIDRCPKCGRFKDVMYQQCLDCYFGRPVSPWKSPVPIPITKQRRRIEYSEAWVDGYMRRDRFFIYILELDDGTLYIGHTTDLRQELADYRSQKKAAKGKGTASLQYLQIVATKRAAELREAELKRLLQSNPEQIRLMIQDFRAHMRDFGYE